MESEGEAVEVHLYIYDLTRGMAQMMSAAFLGWCLTHLFSLLVNITFNIYRLFYTGKQIDGIWHTGVVAYGKEYFFGGGGIQCCPPVSCVLTLINLIVTQIKSNPSLNESNRFC